ncbi:MAG: hypothetical protein PHG85_05865 [Candidatus Altiarchaeota archaeon]|nr:hypothetical protein [Candidatus Altiarchaeota archaeon]
MTERMLLHKLMTVIHRKGSVGIADAASLLKTDEKSIMGMAKILSEPKIVEIVYSMSGEVIVRQGQNFKKAMDDTLQYQDAPATVRKATFQEIEDGKPMMGSKDVADFLTAIRRGKMDKRHGAAGLGGESDSNADEKKT